MRGHACAPTGDICARRQWLRLCADSQATHLCASKEHSCAPTVNTLTRQRGTRLCADGEHAYAPTRNTLVRRQEKPKNRGSPQNYTIIDPNSENHTPSHQELFQHPTQPAANLILLVPWSAETDTDTSVTTTWLLFTSAWSCFSARQLNHSWGDKGKQVGRQKPTEPGHLATASSPASAQSNKWRDKWKQVRHTGA